MSVTIHVHCTYPKGGACVRRTFCILPLYPGTQHISIAQRTIHTWQTLPRMLHY
ncbi:hypothetical protein BAUCODRAFT_364384 [Baudoinia panamericana UAMH 10762]|uniref:Uncharacterized protein n=1 Tax=Baudoinia panamericana (strain UAMH 10762) TaxID=717646 RepID=M2LZG3_BAUPA|nr:uncharacterized protein BAUCODRAFT_364384 [Baudoinia panamericana UAMH 10762]EMD00073.1 hypothetical protein BAUCODRAFT_364384 [Baudoinia panamericana UAMH 10762]